jgi:hypothetical protein
MDNVQSNATVTKEISRRVCPRRLTLVAAAGGRLPPGRGFGSFHMYAAHIDDGRQYGFVPIGWPFNIVAGAKTVVPSVARLTATSRRVELRLCTVVV